MKWSYGVTTVPERLEVLLPTTLKSLEGAGFDKPKIFIDGKEHSHWTSEFRSFPLYLENYDVTIRTPRIRTAGNWILTAWELYLREPTADRYAIFQDDFVTYKNLRQYLEKCAYPRDGYLNLYLFPQNEKEIDGWYLSNQLGKGAVALVFDNDNLRTLFAQEHMINRPRSARRGWKAVDGGIVTAMKQAGRKEYVHNPSLVQHIGLLSSMGNRQHEQAPTFKGEDFDALTLLNKRHEEPPTDNNNDPVNRVGLVGYNAPTGLGELNRQLAEHCHIDRWLIKPHRKFGISGPMDLTDVWSCPIGRKTPAFVRGLETVVFCETPYYRNLVQVAKDAGKNVVCVPMLEWMPSGGRGWPKEVDLFVCPTKHSHEVLSGEGLPCVHFEWPIDTDRFEMKVRKKCERFLFIAGGGGYKGRKGGDVIAKAKEIWPEIPLIEFNQATTQVQENNELYKEGDVLLYPAKVDGLGLQPMEALASGMPVIATDGEPWNEMFLLDRIKATKSRQVVKREIDWYEPDPQHLVDICKKWLGKDIEQHSLAANNWAMKRSWKLQYKKFEELLMPKRARGIIPGTQRWNMFLFKEAVEQLADVDLPTIVEIGAIRSEHEEASRADGYSTIHWANTGYEVITFDTDPQAIELTTNLVRRHDNVDIRQQDGVDGLKGLETNISLLYLDGPEPTEAGQKFALQCYEAAKPKFDAQKAYVLIDDCDFTDGGKGRFVLPKALEDGFEIVTRNQRQILLGRVI